MKIPNDLGGPPEALTGSITPAYWPRLTWCHLTGYWLNRDAVIEEAITATTNSQRKQTNVCFGPPKPNLLEKKSLQASGTKQMTVLDSKNLNVCKQRVYKPTEPKQCLFWTPQT